MVETGPLDDSLEWGIPHVDEDFDTNLGPGQRENESILPVRLRWLVYLYATEDPDIRSQVLDAAESYRNIKLGSKILELGCGGGSDLVSLRTDRSYEDSDLVGLDKYEELFAVNQQRVDKEGLGAIRFVAGNAEDLSDFDDESLDAVMAWYMMYEVDSKKAIAEVWKKLKPGGLLLVTTHGEHNIPIHRMLEWLISEASNNRIINPERKAKNFTVEIARSQLAAQGFTAIDEFHTECPIIIPAKDKHIYRDSIDTRWEEFDPIPLREKWDILMEATVDRYIKRAIQEDGYIRDFMDRWGGVYQKPLSAVESPFPVEEAA